MSENILEVHGVRRTYRMGRSMLEVLRGVDFTLGRGEWCCIYGASGSGKTTLFNLLGALERPDAGEISVCGVRLDGLNRRQAAHFRATRLGFIFQSYHLLPELTVAENVALAGTIGGMSFAAARKRAAGLLSDVGLDERTLHRPAELSGGEQQRAAIARALMNDPELLLADEPTGNLDPRTGEEILALFHELRERSPLRSIVMITHNRDIASRATRVVELRDGILEEA